MPRSDSLSTLSLVKNDLPAPDRAITTICLFIAFGLKGSNITGVRERRSSPSRVPSPSFKSYGPKGNSLSIVPLSVRSMEPRPRRTAGIML